MKPELYICECCGKTFKKDWTDEQAVKERLEKFPDVADEDLAIVCDDCYTEVTEWIKMKSN